MGATSARAEPLAISYNAATDSYTVASGAETYAFAPADARPIRFDGEISYRREGAILTLVTTPFLGGGTSNRFVGMGYLQRNAVTGATQQTVFSSFTYGFDTPGAAVPRTGAAHWLADVFGLLNMPGQELRTVQGLADFNVDFTAGAYRLNGFMEEQQAVTDGGTAGSLTLQSSGLLSSSAGFGGPLSYDSSAGVMHGMLDGRFYGPEAEEVGASFNAQGNGAALAGALTGQRSTSNSTSAPLTNLSLVNPFTTELLINGPGAGLSVALGIGLDTVRASPRSTSVLLTPNGPSAVSVDREYDLRPQDIVADGRANFTTYRTSIEGAPIAISFYKIGSANQELALTYTSFVSWIWPNGEPGHAPPPGGQVSSANFAIFGMPTPRDLLTHRTGTATYTGPLYGSGASYGGTLYDLTGTSRFDVDFSAARYSGALNIQGATSAGAMTDFGAFTFAAPLANGMLMEASLAGTGLNLRAPHVIQPVFYGPGGQEIGASFRFELNTPGAPQNTAMAGIAVAKAR